MFLFLTAVTLIACNSKKETKTDGDKMDDNGKTSKITNMSGYSPDYSSSFAIGDNKNAETILALWKAFDDNQLDGTKDYFADTVEMYFADSIRFRQRL